MFEEWSSFRLGEFEVNFLEVVNKLASLLAYVSDRTLWR